MTTKLCKIMGVIFLVIGITGYFTEPTLVLFGVNGAHNAVHVLSGLLALAAGYAGAHYARLFSVVFGLVYGLVGILGFAGITYLVQLLNLNLADNILHLALGILFVGVYMAEISATPELKHAH